MRLVDDDGDYTLGLVLCVISFERISLVSLHDETGDLFFHDRCGRFVDDGDLRRFEPLVLLQCSRMSEFLAIVEYLPSGPGALFARSTVC